MTKYRTLTGAAFAAEGYGDDESEVRIPFRVGRWYPIKNLLYQATKESGAEYRIVAESGGLLWREMLTEITGTGRQLARFLRVIAANVDD